MECSRCTDEFESPSALSSLVMSGSRVSYSFELELDSVSQYLMSLVFGHKLLYFIYFGVFKMCFRFWEKIFSMFLSFPIMLVVCKLGLNSLVLPPRGLNMGVTHDLFLGRDTITEYS